jgi:sirohydrochlorin cobaltochelatase
MLNDKKRLVLIVHGSKDPSWMVTLKKMEGMLKKDLGENNVRLACIQFVSPTIEETVEEAVRDGMLNLSFFPLFMSAGGHVERDIPLKLQSLKQRWPELNIELLPHIGEHPKFIEVIREIVKDYWE